MMQSKKKILISGCGGFVGKHLTEALEQDFSLVKLTLFEQSGQIAFDIRQKPTAMIKQNIGSIDQAIHMAALMLKTKKDNSLEKSDDFYLSNIIGTLNFLRLIEDKKISHLVYISTIDVYGNNIMGSLVTEATAVAPTTHYAISKLAGEQLCQIFCNEQKIPLAILRLGHIYGPGESDFKKVIPEFIRRATHGDKIEIYGDGSASRNFIYVGDIARAISLVSRKKATGIFNIVGDKSITILKLAELVSKLVGGESKITFSHKNSPQQNFVFDNKKLKEIGFSAKIKLENGLMAEINALKRGK